jgi:GcrA cell cycle regulator
MVTMAAEDWTDEKVKTLTRMWAEGLSASIIGARIGMSRNAVIGKRIRLGLPGRGVKGGRKRASAPSSMPLKPPRDHRDHATINVAELRRLRAEMETAPKQEPKQTPDGAPVPLMITLLDLTDQMCRWIVTDDRPFLYCGHESEPGTAYCEHHYSRMFVGRPVSRATRPMRRAA